MWRSPKYDLEKETIFRKERSSERRNDPKKETIPDKNNRQKEMIP